MYNNQPLLQISSEPAGWYDPIPSIKLCAQNSTLRVVKCTGNYYNGSMVHMPNCWETFFSEDTTAESTKHCYMFNINHKYGISKVDNVMLPENIFNKLNFYWNIDDIQNTNYSSISISAITVQLYDTETYSTYHNAFVGLTNGDFLYLL